MKRGNKRSVNDERESQESPDIYGQDAGNDTPRPAQSGARETDESLRPHARRRRIIEEDTDGDEDEQQGGAKEKSLRGHCLHRKLRQKDRWGEDLEEDDNDDMTEGEEENEEEVTEEEHGDEQDEARRRDTRRRALRMLQVEADRSGDEHGEDEEEDDMHDNEYDMNDGFMASDSPVETCPVFGIGQESDASQGDEEEEMAALIDARAEEYVRARIREEEEEKRQQEEEDDDEDLANLTEQGKIVKRRMDAAITRINERLQAQSKALEDASPARRRAEGCRDAKYGGFTAHFAFGFSNNLEHRTAVINKAARISHIFRKRLAQEVAASQEEGDDGVVYIVYQLSPSHIAEFFNSNQCEMNLVISNLVRETSAATFLHISGQAIRAYNERDRFCAMDYVMRKLGTIYEDEVVEKIKAKQYKVHLAPRSRAHGALDDADEDGNEGNTNDPWTIQILSNLLNRCGDPREAEKVEYIYQAQLSVNLQQEWVMGEVNDCRIRGPTIFKPDLIEVEFIREGSGCKLHLRMIEIKASEQILPKHRIQLSLYVIMMERWLADNGLQCLASRVDLIELDQKHAGVWLLDARWYEKTSVDTLRRDLQGFLQHRMLPILTNPAAARMCGQCRICRQLARAMRTKHGPTLLGPGTEVRQPHLPLTGLLNDYDMSLLAELRALAWPQLGEQPVDAPTVKELVSVLPRLCNLYIAGAWNDPFSDAFSVDGVEVNGDPGWGSVIVGVPDEATKENLIEVVQAHLYLLQRKTVLVLVRALRSVCGVIDATGKWMAFACIYQDFKVMKGEWVPDLEPLLATMNQQEVEENPGAEQRQSKIFVFKVRAATASSDDDDTQMPSQHGHDLGANKLRKFLKSPRDYVLLESHSGVCIIAAVCDKDKGASTVKLTLPPAMPEDVLAEITIRAVKLSPHIRADLRLCIRSIAVMELKQALVEGDTSIKVTAGPWGHYDAGAHQLEVVLNGQIVTIPYVGWEEEDREFMLEVPWQGDIIPARTTVKLAESVEGFTQQEVFACDVNISRSSGVLRVYTLLDKRDNGYRPFLTRKIILRRASCDLMRSLWDDWGADMEDDGPQTDDLVDRSNRVMWELINQGGEAAVLNAALRRMRIQSMLDRKLRLVEEAERSFPQMRPNVEILLSGLSNRFLALRKENYLLCCSITVRMQHGESRELLLEQRFSSLDSEHWPRHGRYADHFLIITLYKICKAVEKMNVELKKWEDQLSIQVYTYDLEFCRTVTQMLADFFCSEGGLLGPQDGDGGADDDEPSLWCMAQYLCIFLTSHTNGILAEDQLAAHSEAEGLDQAVEDKGTKQKSMPAFTRISMLVPIVHVLQAMFALPSLGESPYRVDPISEAFGVAAANREAAGLSSMEELLEYRIDLGDWTKGDRMKFFDRRLKDHEWRAWRIIDSMRRALLFMQDGVALNYAYKCPAFLLKYPRPTLSRLAFMVHHEMELSLEEKEGARKQHVARLEALDLTNRVRLICRYLPPIGLTFEQLSFEARRQVIETYFHEKTKPKTSTIRAMYFFVFGRKPAPRTTIGAIIDELVAYNASRKKDIESFVWIPWKGDPKAYHDFIGIIPHYIFQQSNCQSVAHFMDKDFLLVEATLEGKRAIANYEDCVMAFEPIIRTSYTQQGAHIASRRIASCRPHEPPDSFTQLCHGIGVKPSSFFSVPSYPPRTFKTKAAARSLTVKDEKGQEKAKLLPESGWSMLRDRGTFMQIDHNALTNQQAQARLRDFSTRSRAEYLLFEPVSGYSITHQVKHLDLLMATGNLGEPQVLMDIMRDVIEYNGAARSDLELRDPQAGEHRLTDSQGQAAGMILRQTCTIVRGPPGTGKTHLISSFILRMRRANGTEIPQGRHNSLVVAVTAHQKLGVREIVNRVAENLNGDPSVYVMVAASSMDKREDWGLADTVQWFNNDDLGDFGRALTENLSNRRVFVIGGTVWQLTGLASKIARMKHPETNEELKLELDLLVVDEASQMPVVAASCAAQLVSTQQGAHGRLVFVGDEHQLPPVIRGDYSERSLVFQRYYSNYSAYLPSCADYQQPIATGSVYVGCSSFNRRMMLLLLEDWVPGHVGPRCRLIDAGDGLYKHIMEPLKNIEFDSFQALVSRCPSLQRIVKEDAGDHFFLWQVHSTEHLPIEKSVFENLRVSDLVSQQVGILGRQSCFTQLRETRRMNKLLANVFRHIYEAEEENITLRALPADEGGNAELMLEVDMPQVQRYLHNLDLPKQLQRKVEMMVKPTNCLVVVVLEGVPDWALTHPQVDGPESLVATLFIEALRKGTSTDDVPPHRFGLSYCFVNTPMHRQRRAVTRSLKEKIPDVVGWNVATVDKMQGQEAECVVSLYGYSSTQIKAQPGFVYSRNRINVALSRAKCKAVLFISEQMLILRPSILHNDPVVEAGYAMFRHVCDLSKNLEENGEDIQRPYFCTITASEIQIIKTSYERRALADMA